MECEQPASPVALAKLEGDARMAKYVGSHIKGSLRVVVGLLAATLLGQINGQPLRADEPGTSHAGPLHSGHDIGTLESSDLIDTSCEPSFRGGDCQDCCLDLWSEYCSQRTDCHCSAPRLGGLGCLPLGFCFGGRFLGGDCDRCACHQPLVASQPAPAARGQDAHRGSGEVEGVDPDSLTPPANPLPPTPADNTEVKSHRAGSQPATVEAPLPPRIHVRMDPPNPTGVRVKTAAARGDAGTTRLLRQLQSE
jgi:hypothetical protein